MEYHVTSMVHANMNLCLSQDIVAHAQTVQLRNEHPQIQGCVVAMTSRMRASVS